MLFWINKNNEKNINHIKYLFENTGKNFKEYKIIIFDNDSTDNTRSLLKKWSKINKNVILLNCCDINNCNCILNINLNNYSWSSKERINKMAYFRNKYF